MIEEHDVMNTVDTTIIASPVFMMLPTRFTRETFSAETNNN